MKVAIAFVDAGSYCEDVGQIMIHRHITDWQEVSEEERQYLKQGIAMHNSKNYNGTQMYMVTLPTEQGQIVFDTIDQGKEYFRKLEEASRKHREEMEARREADRKRREAAKKKKDLTLPDKKKLLEKLKKEIESEEKTKKDEKV